MEREFRQQASAWPPGLTRRQFLRLMGASLALACLLWLGILIVGTLDDYVTRGWLPVPGH